jgi:hypothetical protein
VTAVIAAGTSVAAAALIAVGAYANAAVLAAAVALTVVALAVGWAPLIDLPHPQGSAILVGGTGLAALGVAVAVRDAISPLAAFAGVIAGAVLAAFGHELLRRDGRIDVVESVTGSLSGQVVAVLGAGWVLLPGTPAGKEGMVVAAAGVGAARIAAELPWRVLVTAWVGFAFGVAGSTAAALAVGVIPLGTAATIGVTVAGAVAALDRLLGSDLDGQRSPGLMAAGAAPVCVAGTVAYAAVRLLVQ